MNKKIGGAGLDVTDPEPIEPNDPLTTMDNVGKNLWVFIRNKTNRNC